MILILGDQQHARQRRATRLTGNDIAGVVTDLALGAGRRTGVSHLAKARLKQLGQERGRVRQQCLVAQEQPTAKVSS